MEDPQYAGHVDLAQGETQFTPNIWLDVQNRAGTKSPCDRYFVASIQGLQALKCSGVTGYGTTEEEAVRNLRRKVLQYLDMNSTYERRE
jgi:hypothetical protein